MQIRWPDVGRRLAIVLATLVVATLVVAVLEDGLGVPTAASVYLVAVAVSALVAGRPAAVVAAVGSFIGYDVFFIEPRYTLTVNDPTEWLNLLVLLFVGLLVGQLAALQRERTETAEAREREALALFSVSRELATRSSTLAALPMMLDVLRRETSADRLWVALDEAPGMTRVVADTDPTRPRPEPRSHVRLQRMPGDEPARWVAIHTGVRAGTPRPGPRDGSVAHRVAIEAGGRTLGSIWTMVPRSAGTPGPTATRLLAAAADQVGQALEQDRLANESRDAEIARESDRLKSALLESVSHDLRTPLASIRAAAGTLMDPTVALDEAERHESAELIDAEADHLNRLVTNLLDLSRIEAGSIRAQREVLDLADPTERAVARARTRLGGRPVTIAVDGVAPVRADPVFLDQILSNLLENVARYADPEARVRIAASGSGDDVRISVEDSGPGVPDASLRRLFDKFYRVPGRAGGSRSGTGVGLAVVRGLAEAMGGRVSARRSELGGLAVDLTLPAVAAEQVPS